MYKLKQSVAKLREENSDLSKRLLFADKCLLWFEKYRNCLRLFSDCCNCDENMDNKVRLNDLENEYNSFVSGDDARQPTLDMRPENGTELMAGVDDIENKCANRQSSRVKRNVRPAISPVRYRKIVRRESQHNDSDSDNDCDDEEEEDEDCDNDCVDDQNKDADHDLDYSSANDLIKYTPKERKMFIIKSEKICAKPVFDKTKKLMGYRCEYANCDFEHKVKGNMSQHIKKMHLNKQPLACEKCGEKIWGRQRMVKHRQALHCELAVTSDSKRFKCDWTDCQFESKNLNSMREHLRRHVGDKQFQCNHVGCGSSFVTNNERKMHEILVHSEAMPFRCEWPGCEQAFKTAKYLKYHAYAHTGDYPCVCAVDDCGMKFAKNCDLKYHVLVAHSDDRPFRCEWPGCEFGSKTKNSLRMHNFTHTGERPLICEWPGCEAAFYMNSHLKRHKRIHDSEKKYACDWPSCPKRFTDSYNLKLHVMAHRGEKPIKCELYPKCKKMFAEKSRMHIHVKKMHRNKE